MQGRDTENTVSSTGIIFQSMAQTVANIQSRQRLTLFTPITSLEVSMLEFNNLLPCMEIQLTALIAYETDANLLDTALMHCKKCITEEIKTVAEGRAHRFVNEWKQRLALQDIHDPLYMKDDSNYHHFKQRFNYTSPQLDSFLHIYNHLISRMYQLSKMKHEKNTKHKPDEKTKPTNDDIAAIGHRRHDFGF
jgi:hypothetical protein